MIGEQNKKMKKKENIVTKKINTIIITFLILVFFIGFFAGMSFSDKSLKEYQISYHNAQLNLKSFYQRSQFMDEFNFNLCQENLINDISQEMYEIGKELTELEKEGKVDTINYDLMKKQHNVNQVNFYVEYKKYIKSCNVSPNIIIFFFNASNQEISEKQGIELDKLVDKKNTIIIPMDYQYTPAIKFFYDYYDLNELPSLILNFNKTLNGYQTYENILTNSN